MIRTREVQISKPVFHTYDEKVAYESIRIDPQQYIDGFVSRLKGVKTSLPPQYDSLLERVGTCGSCIITVGHEAIKIGTGYIRDSELFKTIFHEEMHLRIRRKARWGSIHHLNIATHPDDFVEEKYVEDVALRYYRLYTARFGQFDH